MGANIVPEPNCLDITAQFGEMRASRSQRGVCLDMFGHEVRADFRTLIPCVIVVKPRPRDDFRLALRSVFQ